MVGCGPAYGEDAEDAGGTVSCGRCACLLLLLLRCFAISQMTPSTISGPGTNRPKSNDDIIAIAMNTQAPTATGQNHGWSVRIRSPSTPWAAERSLPSSGISTQAAM